ncbi:spondin domain-containing protein [Ancylomarina sp. DW003]|nr:spondin domain-containing protein [Ancylomarina sp. DW003]MDE5422464.1 spondin domain-containing protein [Ancylomarina sp. DW003]
MKKLKSFLCIILGLVVMSCSDSDGPIETGIESDATYTVTFTMHWNSTNFPTDYPTGAHFSPLIGWSHKASSTFFKVGTEASAGIKSMAETGATGTLKTELEEKITAGEGLDFVLGSGLSSGTGEITVDVEVNADNPAITLVTMVAPSPDWYVAALNVNLYDGSNFVVSKTITAAVYDAGTDSGSTFASADVVTDPKGKISEFLDAPLGDGTELPTAFATVTFTKK